MQIPRKIVETVEAKSVQVRVKACDSGHYTLIGSGGKVITVLEDYVPSFFPEEHYGDYLILDIDLETGRVLNWRKPDPIIVAREFGLLSEDEHVED